MNWKSVYRQIVAAGYAEIDIQGYGGLSLTKKGRTFLKSKETIYLRKEVVKPKKPTDLFVTRHPLYCPTSNTPSRCLKT